MRFMQPRPTAHNSRNRRGCGTSERSLRRQFQCFTGQSPIAFHRHLRLEAARQAISGTEVKADITTTAGLYGFSHLSHFSGQYRRRFGELPSTTLRAAHESLLPLPSHAVSAPIRLIVHPFKCTDQRSSDATFAETMTDRVISTLARTRRLNVLPPADDVRVLPCGARYEVRGRVQWIGGRVLAVVRMIDVATGRQVWGNAFESAGGCDTEFQRQVADAVASALPVCIHDAEATPGTPKPERDPAAIRHRRRHCTPFWQ